jgi:hypothetical protein
MRVASEKGKRPPPRLEASGQRLALEKLHDDVGGAVGKLAEFEDLDDAGVLHATGGARFVEKALGHLRVLREVSAQELDGGLATQLLVYGFVHGTHAALAHLAHHPVATDALAFHKTLPP